MTTTTANLALIPVDTLDHVVSALSMNDAFCLSACCKTLRAHVRSMQLHVSISRNREPDDLADLARQVAPLHARGLTVLNSNISEQDLAPLLERSRSSIESLIVHSSRKIREPGPFPRLKCLVLSRVTPRLEEHAAGIVADSSGSLHVLAADWDAVASVLALTTLKTPVAASAFTQLRAVALINAKVGLDPLGQLPALEALFLGGSFLVDADGETLTAAAVSDALHDVGSKGRFRALRLAELTFHGRQSVFVEAKDAPTASVADLLRAAESGSSSSSSSSSGGGGGAESKDAAAAAADTTVAVAGSERSLASALSLDDEADEKQQAAEAAAATGGSLRVIDFQNMSAADMNTVSLASALSASVRPLLRSALSFAANCVDKWSRTPLHYAVLTNNLPMVRFLASLGVDLEVKDKRGCSPLWRAAEMGHTECLRALMAAGADFAVKSHALETPLFVAALKGRAGAVEALLKGVRDPKMFANASLYHDAWSPASAACIHGDGQILAMLIEHRILLDLPNRYGHTPLHIASRLGNLAAVKALLAAGVDVNAGTPHVLSIVSRKNGAEITAAVTEAVRASGKAVKQPKPKAEHKSAAGEAKQAAGEKPKFTEAVGAAGKGRKQAGAASASDAKAETQALKPKQGQRKGTAGSAGSSSSSSSGSWRARPAGHPLGAGAGSS